MSTVPAAPPIQKNVLGYRQTRTLTLNPNTNPKINKKTTPE